MFSECIHILPYSVLHRKVYSPHTVCIMVPLIQAEGHLQSSVNTGCWPLSAAEAGTSAMTM